MSHPMYQTAALPVVEPAYRFAFPEAAGIRSVVVDPGGTRAYADTVVEVVDLWGLTVAHWPELLGGATLLLALLGLAAVLRVRRRPQAAGAPHCRRCNYDLSAHVRRVAEPRRPTFVAAAGTRCPECGTDVAARAPRVGRRPWRRLLLPLAPAAVALLLYGGMWAAGLPRQGRAEAWIDWTSAALVPRAKASGWAWIQPFIKHANRLMEIDLADGKTRPLRTVAAFGLSGLTVSPDGGHLYAMTHRTVGKSTELGVARIGLPGGGLTARTVLPGAVHSSRGFGSAILGFWDSGSTVLIECIAYHDEQSAVVAWEPTTGTLKTLVATDVYIRSSIPRRALWGREFTLRPGAERPRFISVPNFMEAHGEKRYDLRVHGDDGAVERTVEFGVRLSPEGRTVVTPDGMLAMTPSQYGRSIAGIDLQTGEATELHLGQMENAWDMLALSADGRVLAVPVHKSILLRDVGSRRWLARLTHPPDLYAPHPSLSSDGSWVGACCQKNTAGAGQIGRTVAHEIVLWDTRRTPPAPGTQGVEAP